VQSGASRWRRWSAAASANLVSARHVKNVPEQKMDTSEISCHGALLAWCSPDVHQEPKFKREGPRGVILGPSVSTGYVGGRRWFRTTDPLLVRQVLSP
jgi:hypothetical protein